MIDKDRGGEENWRCQLEEFVVTQVSGCQCSCGSGLVMTYQGKLDFTLLVPFLVQVSGDTAKVWHSRKQYKYVMGM